jgi:hypothetical protein
MFCRELEIGLAKRGFGFGDQGTFMNCLCRHAAEACHYRMA